MPKLAFWFEFASTYSYLTAMRIEALATEARVEIVWRPFLLGPIFQSQGWATSPFNIYEAKGQNMWRDMERQAARYGLPAIVRPDPFPQNGLLAARVATYGADQPWGAAFVRAVYAAQFAEGLSITEDVIAQCGTKVGQDGVALVERVKTDQSIKDALRQATEEAQALGIYGAPSFVTEDGELFWGNDRLEEALVWAKRG